MIPDDALERNRRLAWARFFGTRAALEDERMVTAELAVWIEETCPPAEGSPLRELLDELLERHSPHVVDYIRRYVRAKQDPDAFVALLGIPDDVDQVLERHVGA